MAMIRIGGQGNGAARLYRAVWVRATGRLSAALIGVVVALALAGEGAMAADLQGTLMHGGETRTYRLHLPSRPGPLPVVILLHGGGGDADRIERISGFPALANREGFAVISPEALHGHWNDGRDFAASEAHRRGVDDVGFLGMLIDLIAADPRLDGQRVYVAGASNGGMMALRLACERTGRLAAVAAVIANQPWPQADRCRPTAPLPLLVINGTDDPLMPWGGGSVGRGLKDRGRVISTDETVALWRRANGCNWAPTMERLTNRDRRDRVSVDRIRWAPCRDGAEVQLLRMNGGGHRWPGGPKGLFAGLLGRGTDDADATAEIWRFFRDRSR